MSDLLSVIQKNQESIRQAWLQNIKGGIRRRDLMEDRELEKQVSEVLNSIADAPAGTGLKDLNNPAWGPLKDLLGNISSNRDIIVSMAAIHISEAEATRDFAALLARVRAGAEVVIEDHGRAAAVLRVVAEPPLRRLSESLRMAREHGSTVTLDGGFAADLEEVVNSHLEPLENLWD